MKTLIFNGSPRKNGDTIKLILEITKKLNGEVKIINSYYDKISPCIDCRYCQNNEKCIIDDDMQEIYKYLIECDNIIIASPLYFSELTGPLLSVLSRLQMLWSSKLILHKNLIQNKKNGVLVITAGNKGDTKSAENTAKVIFKLINVELIGTVFSLNTDTIPAYEDAIAIENASKIANKLNKL
jgi:multimeric flavodoxin WrbA